MLILKLLLLVYQNKQTNKKDPPHSLAIYISNAQVPEVLHSLPQDFQGNGTSKLSQSCSESKAVHPGAFEYPYL